MKAEAKSADSSGGVLRAAGVMGAATFLSRIMGLVREQVFAVLFGAGNATDAFNIAFRIPNLLRDLFAEGAMSAALVPTFTRVRTEQGERRAWRLAGLVFRVLFVLVFLLSILGIAFAPQLVSLYASAYKSVPGKFELTVRMTRTMFPFFPLVALAAAFMGILNACGRFFIPAFSSALFNLTSVVFGVLLTWWLPRYGFQPIEGMAIGVVIGGAVQAFSQLPSLRDVGYRWQPRQAEDPSWRDDPALRRMLVMMVPGTVGLAATQLNVLVNSVLATSQGSGAVSYLNYAFRLMQFPIGIFGVSLASATLPRVSQLWVNRDVQGVNRTLTQSIRHVMAINLPASAGLAFLGLPIIQLLFQYGRFRFEDAQATALALAAYSLGLTAYSAVKVLVPACYALGNTRVPVVSSVLAVCVTITLNLIMVKPFGFIGLALGTSIAAIVNMLFLMFSVRRLIARQGEPFGYSPLLKSLGSNLLVSLLMGGLCFLSHRGLDRWISDAVVVRHFGAHKGPLALARGFKVGLLVLEGVILIVLLARVFKLRDTSEMVGVFAKKLKNKVSRRRN